MILIMNVLCQDLIGLMPVLFVRILMMLMNLSSSGAAFRLAARKRTCKPAPGRAAVAAAQGAERKCARCMAASPPEVPRASITPRNFCDM